MNLKDCKNKKSQWIDFTVDMRRDESEARLGLSEE